MSDFVHFFTQTSASFGKSLLRPNDIITDCYNNNQPAVALCDFNNAFLAMRFAKLARAKGIQPIHGARISVDINNFLYQNSGNSFTKNSSLFATIAILASSQEGWTSLCKILSKGWENGRSHKSFYLKLEDVVNNNNGLILLSGGSDGAIGKLNLLGKFKESESCLQFLKQGFKDRFYLELFRQTKTDTQEEAKVLELSEKYNLPVLASHRVVFREPDDFKAHEVLQCILQHKKVQDDNSPKSHRQQTLLSTAEIRKLFNDLPEACDNTIALAQRIHFALNSANRIIFPNFPITGKISAGDYLTNIAEKGLEDRLKSEVLPQCSNEVEANTKTKIYQNRLKKELTVLKNIGYEGYFLIVADFIKFATNNNIPVGVGRGSAAGSIVSWVLKITGLDPIKHGLLFERFINPERLSPPDIDIDFCQDKRDEVIKYVQKQYGEKQVARIITFGRLQARAVTRDVGRVLGMSYLEVDTIARLIPENASITKTSLSEMLDDKNENFVAELKNEFVNSDNVNQLLTFAIKLEGLYRNASLHAAGIVISNQPIENNVPLFCDHDSDMLATQFDMEDIAETGMLKFDFLGLTTLSIIKRAQDLLQLRNITIHLHQIPQDDKKTFSMLKNDGVLGVFQIESDGMRRVNHEIQPDSLADVIALVALFRPGPMKNIPKYIARKHGEETIEYLHPLLENVLKETYGIAVYQEQVMRITQVLASFSLEQADVLRAAMGKKIASKIAQMKQPFIDGALKNKVDKNTAIMIYGELEEFANYGFNKSHAAAYGLTSYYTAYLKCHYPTEFLAASMDYNYNDVQRLSIFVKECKSLCIKVLSPNINQSDVRFSIPKHNQSCIRYGLQALKNVGKGICETIISERNTGGEFISIEDFFRRMPREIMNSRALTSLINSGAFSDFNFSNDILLDQLPVLVAYNQQCEAEKTSKQQNLFGDSKNLSLPSLTNNPKLLNQDSYNQIDTITNEARAFGFYFNRHPLELYQETLKSRITVNSIETSKVSYSRKNSFTMAGVLHKIKTLPMSSKRRKPMSVLTFSDFEGPFEIITFGDKWIEKLTDLQNSNTPAFLTVSFETLSYGNNSSTGRRLELEKIEPLESISVNSGLNYRLFACAEEFNPHEFQNIVNEIVTRGKQEIKLSLQNNDGYILEFSSGNSRYNVDKKVLEKLSRIKGVIKIVPEHESLLT